VAEQAPLDVLAAQGLLQKRVVDQVDLADREVVGSTPVGVEQPQLLRIEDRG
jgi:hypothetical protein